MAAWVSEEATEDTPGTFDPVAADWWSVGAVLYEAATGLELMPILDVDEHAEGGPSEGQPARGKCVDVAAQTDCSQSDHSLNTETADDVNMRAVALLEQHHQWQVRMYLQRTCIADMSFVLLI